MRDMSMRIHTSTHAHVCAYLNIDNIYVSLTYRNNFHKSY